MLTSDFHIHPHRQACSGIYTCMHTHKINASSKKAGCTLGLSPCLLVTTGHGFLSTPRSSSSTWDLPPLQADPGALWFRMLQCDDALKFFYHRVPSQVGHFQPEASYSTSNVDTLGSPQKCSFLLLTAQLETWRLEHKDLEGWSSCNHHPVHC